MADLQEREDLRARSDELLCNFRSISIPQLELTNNWRSVWDKFNRDVCSYVMLDSLPSEDSPKNRHSFSVTESTLQLRRVILQNSQLDIFPEIRKEVLKILYAIANSFVVHNLIGNKPLLGFLEGYAKIAPKTNIVICSLTMVLNKFITRAGI